MDMYNNLPWGMTPIQYNDNRKTEFHIGSVGSINNGPVTNNYYYSHSEEKATAVTENRTLIEKKIAECLDRLMTASNGKERVFKSKCHWIAVYRVIVDYGLGVVNNDYIGFCNYIERIHPTPFPVLLSHSSVKDAPKGRYDACFKDWKYDITYHKNRKPYEDMCKVVATFVNLLREYSVIS